MRSKGDAMNIVVFEDEYFGQYGAVAEMRPVWDLRAGAFLQHERIERYVRKHLASAKVSYTLRTELVPLMHEKYPEFLLNDYSFVESDEETYFVNASACNMDAAFSLKNESISVSGSGRLIAAHVSSPYQLQLGYKTCIGADAFLSCEKYQAAPDTYFNYIWDFIKLNGRLISEDFAAYSVNARDNTSLTIVGDPCFCKISAAAEIQPFVVIDTTKGPVIIDDGTVVNPFSRIEGPVFYRQKMRYTGSQNT